MALFQGPFDNEYANFLTILVVNIIIVTFSYFILKFIVKRIAGKRKRYGLFILKQLSIPTLFLIFLIGLYSATKTVSFLDGYSSQVDGIFFVVSTFVVALLMSRIITVILAGYLKVHQGFKRAPNLINKATSIAFFVIAIIVILEYFKIDITPLVAGVGLGALAIGLALQSTLSNFFAGVHLISDRPINVGDFIELGPDTAGYVEDIGWRSTRIKTWTDNLLIIPNAKLADSNILNYSMPKQDMSFWVPCGVAYESNLKQVEKIALEVAKKIQETTDGAVRDFQPAFRFKEFDESNINFITILRAEEPMKRFSIRNEFIKELKERFDKEKIEISWPIRKIYNIK